MSDRACCLGPGAALAMARYWTRVGLSPARAVGMGKERTMTMPVSRRRAMQTALATAAVAAAPASRALARQATPVADEPAAVTTAQVEAALARLDDFIEDAHGPHRRARRGGGRGS